MSSWVPPSHHLTQTVLQGWANDVEKATAGRVKFQMLPKAPAAPPGTFDAVRDGLVDLSYVTASYTPARHHMPLMAELPGAGATAEIKHEHALLFLAGLGLTQAIPAHGENQNGGVTVWGTTAAYAMAAAVGSLMMRSTVSPAMVPEENRL